MVDLHAHLPQLPNAGLGAGLDLLTWLERYIFPLERGFDVADRRARRAGRLARLRGRGHDDGARLRRGLRGEPRRHVPGCRGARHPGDRRQGDDGSGHLRPDHRARRHPRAGRSPRRARLIERWHGADDGRLRYAVTPRFAVSCTAELLRESAALAASTGAYWQTHVSEDRGEIAEVARLFPEALDYVDVYDRAGGLGERTVLAHAVHLSDRELGRLVETGTRVAHCPVSNLFLASGVMPLGRYLDAGLTLGLGSDVAGGPDLSIFTRDADRVLRAERAARGGRRGTARSSAPLDWLRLGLARRRARRSGLGDVTGSLEAGKEADVIAVDPAVRRADPGRRGRRARGPRQPPDLPRPPRHGPRRLGPRPPPGGSGRADMSSDEPKSAQDCASCRIENAAADRGSRLARQRSRGRRRGHPDGSDASLARDLRDVGRAVAMSYTTVGRIERAALARVSTVDPAGPDRRRRRAATSASAPIRVRRRFETRGQIALLDRLRARLAPQPASCERRCRCRSRAISGRGTRMPSAVASRHRREPACMPAQIRERPPDPAIPGPGSAVDR